MDTEGAQKNDAEAIATIAKDGDGEPFSEAKAEPSEDATVPKEESDVQPGGPLKTEDEEESKDWLELPMLEKLDSLHLLTEWQFQNPYRLRQLMKDDDDMANWVRAISSR